MLPINDVVILKEGTPFEDPSVFSPATELERAPIKVAPAAQWWSMGFDEIGK